MHVVIKISKVRLCPYLNEVNLVIKICKIRLYPYLNEANVVIKVCKVRLYPYLHEANDALKICEVRQCPYLHEVNVAINTLEVVEGAFSLPIDCHKKQYIVQSTGKSETLSRIILIIYTLLLLDAGGQSVWLQTISQKDDSIHHHNRTDGVTFITTTRLTV